MSEAISLNTGNFVLNTSPLKIRWNPNWIIADLSIRNWEKSYYRKIQAFRRDFQNDTILLDSTGRKLVFIDLTGKRVSNSVIAETVEELESVLETSISYSKVEVEGLQDVEEKNIQDTITNALGEYLSYKLRTDLEFEKTGSGGSVGRFFHHSFSRTVKLSNDPNIDIVSQFEFILNIDWTSSCVPFLSIDIKSQVDGTIVLYDLIMTKQKENRSDISSYKKDQLVWKIEKHMELAEWKSIFEDEFELQELLKADKAKELTPNLFVHSELKTNTISQFLKNIGLSMKRDDYIAVLKKRNDPNPNNRYYWPSSLLVKNITNSFIVNKPYEKKFHKLSKPTVKERKETISRIFSLLESKGLTEGMIEFESNYPEIAYPSVKGNYLKEYGKTPPLWKWGVQKWGSLKKIRIFATERNQDVAEKMVTELSRTMNELAEKSGVEGVQIDSELYNYKQIQKVAEDIDPQVEETLYIFISGKGKTEPQYNRIKKWFTIDNKKPVQFFRISSLIRNKMRATVRTAIPQLLAKTGGLPYELSPKILDKALIIGLDKGRDSHSSMPSASAGVAAVTPKGEYIAGASTKIDTTKHDAIDVDELAPELLEHLVDEYKNNLEYVVILRDGSPQISKSEIKPWKKYLEEYNLKMIFFASRKENPYRVFPRNIGEERRVRYRLPVILNGTPLPNNEFLGITANPIQGTPQPVLYTLMENTTEFNEEEIINKVIPQVLSMSMLCWESPHPTSQPLPLHYADKLAEFTQKTKQKWRSSIKAPMFI